MASPSILKLASSSILVPIQRLPKDIHDLKTRDNTQKGVIVSIWLITIAFVGIAGYYLVSFVLALAGR